MIHFSSMSVTTFLNDYWQKKPLVLRQAMPGFTHPLTADELAGFALDDDVESRIVLETPGIAPFWRVKTGPFLEKEFATLPKTHWTLLVQGVDRLDPQVMLLLDQFDFIPSWRLDDVMISFAVKGGSVGPHYDHYDVFLYQASGRRKWSLTTQNCHPENYLEKVDLRIMAQFDVEEEYLLEPGDMLYLPPHVGHHGVSLSDDCMTYSFGYRSFKAQELWESFGDFLAEQHAPPEHFRDPNWSTLSNASELPLSVCIEAKNSLQALINKEVMFNTWFGCFVTRIEPAVEAHIPLPIEEEEWGSLAAFVQELSDTAGLIRDATCRMAVMIETGDALFINGVPWAHEGVSHELILYVTNYRLLHTEALMSKIHHEQDQQFLYELWKLQWLQWLAPDLLPDL